MSSSKVIPCLNLSFCDKNEPFPNFVIQLNLDKFNKIRVSCFQEFVRIVCLNCFNDGSHSNYSVCRNDLLSFVEILEKLLKRSESAFSEEFPIAIHAHFEERQLDKECSSIICFESISKQFYIVTTCSRTRLQYYGNGVYLKENDITKLIEILKYVKSISIEYE